MSTTTSLAYLDCATGISGDMTLAALLDAGVDERAVRDAIDSLELPGVRLVVGTVVKGGFRAKTVRVEHPEQHAHRHLRDIEAILARGALSPNQRDIARRIFHAIARAEALVHGTTLDKIHFHEVGAVDSIVDIVGAAVGFDLLGVDEIHCSRIPTGRGQVKIDHGWCPVPTPGTAELLKGIPLADVPIDSELTTPTGAAIVSTLVQRFGPLPAMTVRRIGYGAGTKEFPLRANVLRLFLGEVDRSPDQDEVTLLETNLDDVAPEIIGYTKQQLLTAGALDVHTTSAQMKKDRPGVVLSVIARPADAARLEAILFTETRTLGVRHQTVRRSVRQREAFKVETEHGAIRGKLAWRTGEAPLFSPEYDDCAKIARATGAPLHQIYRSAELAYAAQPATIQSPPATPLSMPTEQDSHHAHDHDHDVHDHSHDHSHDHDHGSHDHDHDHRHDHDHGHRHDHSHDHDAHGHDHDHGHRHDHD